MGSRGEVDNISGSRKASIKIKRKIHDEYILPVMTYGCETWALNNAMMNEPVLPFEIESETPGSVKKLA